MYQIGVTDNATSVDLAEYVLGVPKNCMVRICDEGRKYGNDYEILNVSQAFSTGSISDEPFACFPVIDENGNKLIGLAATKYLLDNLDIRPSVCLDKADPDRQKHLLAMAEKNIKQTSNEFKKNKNLIYSSQFGVNDGLYDVYDSDTGGVKFYDYEWDLIDDANPFKELFEKKNSSGQYVNKIESNDATILRGPDSYYYFLSKCVREKEISSEDLKIWRDNTVSELNDFLNALKMAVHDNSINRRFKLAIMDNLRNLSLIMLNVKMVEKFNGTNVHILFDTYKEDTQINKWVEICENVFDGMGKLTTVGNTEELDDKIVETICNIKKIYSNDVNISIDRADSSLNAKAYRNYREIDCYGENRLTLEYAIEKIKEEKPSLNEKDVSFNGMVYGGMELPFIAKEILGKQNNVILGEIMHAGNYTTRHSQTIKDLEKEMFTIYGDSSTLKGHNIVMDDNVLTGKTLQIALNGMFNNDIFVNDVIAVRYPPINRISQMFENNHGAIDTTHFFTYIKGLIIPSPYAKLGYSATKNSLGIQYKDEFNVFDVKKRKICEYIYKTGNYSHGSKVEKELRGERIYG